MTKFFFAPLACSIVFGCAAQPAASPGAETAAQTASAGDDITSLKAQLAHLEARLAALEQQKSGLESTVFHLKADVEAANPDDEFTTMVVDSVCWSKKDAPSPFGAKPVLLLHPVEWRGYGKMRRFTQLSDPVIYLEAEGKPPIEVDVACGGICNSDGSTRFVMAQPKSPLEPGVSYRVVPRNDNDKYKWSAPDALVVSTSTPTR